MAPDHRTRGLLFAQLNAFFAAMSFVTGQMVTDHMHPLRYTALMYLIAIPANLLWWWGGKRGWLPRLEAPDTGVHADIPPVRSLRSSARGYRWLLAQSLFSALALNFMWLGLSMTSAAVGALITRCELLVAVALGMLVLRERFTGREWLGFGLSLFGVFGLRLTVLQDAQADAFLNLALGALFWGLTEVTGKLLIQHMPVATAMPLRAALMAPMLCLCWWLKAPGWPAMDLTLALWLLLAALLGPVLSRNCYMLAISYLPVSQVVVLNQTTPLYSAAGEWLLRAVLPTWQTVVGGAAIVLGNVILVHAKHAAKEVPPSTPIQPLPQDETAH